MIALYLNTYLTRENVWNSNSIRPLCVSKGSLESQKKAEILKLQLRSLSHLGFEKAVINIDGEDFFRDQINNINNELNELIPNCLIVSEGNRPSNINEWKESLKFIEGFIGPNVPILCMFNHDHIFVEHNIYFAKKLIDDFFKECKDGFLYYSHTPELLSSALFQEYYLKRLFRNQSHNLKQTRVRAINNHIFEYKLYGYIDSYFFTTTSGLDYLWSNAIINSDYIPRPDWRGVSHINSEFVIGNISRELFRHFDGYGHVSNIPTLQGMLLKDYNGEGQYINRVLLEELYLKRKLDETILCALAKLYVRIFKEVHILGLRDVAYVLRGETNQSVSFRNAMDRLVHALVTGYILPDCDTYNVDKETKDMLIKLTINYIYSEENGIAQLVISDIFSMR